MNMLQALLRALAAPARPTRPMARNQVVTGSGVETVPVPANWALADPPSAEGTAIPEASVIPIAPAKSPVPPVIVATVWRAISPVVGVLASGAKVMWLCPVNSLPGRAANVTVTSLSMYTGKNIPPPRSANVTNPVSLNVPRPNPEKRPVPRSISGTTRLPELGAPRSVKVAPSGSGSNEKVKSYTAAWAVPPNARKRSASPAKVAARAPVRDVGTFMLLLIFSTLYMKCVRLTISGTL